MARPSTDLWLAQVLVQKLNRKSRQPILLQQPRPPMTPPTHIYFWGHRGHGRYRFLSNFYPATFEDPMLGLTFHCSEQHFMYRKCLTFDPSNVELLTAIMSETDPAQIKNLGRQVRNYNDAVWTAQRYEVMMTALRLKFMGNDDLRSALIATEDAFLVEASPYDRVWGIGFSVKDAAAHRAEWGENLLGRALMEIRVELGGQAPMQYPRHERVRAVVRPRIVGARVDI